MKAKKNATSRSRSNANNSIHFNPVITVNDRPSSPEETNTLLFDMLDSSRRENEALVHQLRLKAELMAYKDKEIARLEADNAKLKGMLNLGFAS